MRIAAPLVCALLLSACASSAGLRPGTDTIADVERAIGTPAMRWRDPDGSIQMAFPQHPYGLQNFMVRFGPDGKLTSAQPTLTPENFRLVQPGMTKEQVLRLLGPSDPSRTVYFERRDELAWDWLFDENGETYHFIVLFDATRGTVRSALVRPLRVLIDPH